MRKSDNSYAKSSRSRVSFHAQQFASNRKLSTLHCYNIVYLRHGGGYCSAYTQWRHCQPMYSILIGNVNRVAVDMGISMGIFIKMGLRIPWGQWRIQNFWRVGVWGGSSGDGAVC